MKVRNHFKAFHHPQISGASSPICPSQHYPSIVRSLYHKHLDGKDKVETEIRSPDQKT
jgi:hypothetical protein